MCFKLSKKNRITKKGFTLVELSLSIAFIAILSIAVTLIITNSIASYHRGLTLNSINTFGMDLVNDMEAAIQNAPAYPPKNGCSLVFSSDDYDGSNTTSYDALKECEDDGGSRFVSVVRKGKVEINGRMLSDAIPVFGAFCTGRYSYIWNSGYFFSNDSESSVKDVSMASLVYKIGGNSSSGEIRTNTISNFKLLKLRDEERSVCISAVAKKNNGSDLYSDEQIDSVFDITGDDFVAIDENPVDILSEYILSDDLNDDSKNVSSNNLAIYDLSSMAPAVDSSMNNILYNVSFILGTIQGGVNINASGNFCATPEGYDSMVENFDYCAINKFNFAAQAIGGRME